MQLMINDRRPESGPQLRRSGDLPVRINSGTLARIASELIRRPQFGDQSDAFQKGL